MTPDKFYYAVSLIALAIAEKYRDLDDHDINELLYLIGEYKDGKLNDRSLMRLNRLFVKYKDTIETIQLREQTF